MEVYLVWEGYEDVIGVFSTYEKAIAFQNKRMEKYKGTYLSREDRFNIIKEIIDAPQEA